MNEWMDDKKACLRTWIGLRILSDNFFLNEWYKRRSITERYDNFYCQQIFNLEIYNFSLSCSRSLFFVLFQFAEWLCRCNFKARLFGSRYTYCTFSVFVRCRHSWRWQGCWQQQRQQRRLRRRRWCCSPSLSSLSHVFKLITLKCTYVQRHFY